MAYCIPQLLGQRPYNLREHEDIMFFYSQIVITSSAILSFSLDLLRANGRHGEIKEG